MTQPIRPASRGRPSALWLLTARRRLMLAAALGLPWLAGCVVAPHGRQPVGYGPPVYGQPAYGQPAPPPPQYEVMGMAPAPGYVWVNGYWAWQLSRYVWVSGHWSPPRHHGVPRWSPPRAHHWPHHGWPHGRSHGWPHGPGGGHLPSGRWEPR